MNFSSAPFLIFVFCCGAKKRAEFSSRSHVLIAELHQHVELDSVLYLIDGGSFGQDEALAVRSVATHTAERLQVGAL